MQTNVCIYKNVKASKTNEIGTSVKQFFRLGLCNLGPTQILEFSEKVVGVMHINECRAYALD